MDDLFSSIEHLSSSVEGAIRAFTEEASIMPLAKRQTEWQGDPGSWKRVGGFNLFLRHPDGVIMNGPRAFQGQPIKNIGPDDWRAIPVVADIYSREGDAAVPGEDIAETSNGAGTATLVHDTGKAVVSKGFGAVAAKLYAGKRGRSYTPTVSKTFRTGKKDTEAFEKAKAWARMQLRSGSDG